MGDVLTGVCTPASVPTMTTTDALMSCISRIDAAQAAVTFTAKRSNKVPAAQYQRAVKELLDARAAARAANVDDDRI